MSDLYGIEAYGDKTFEAIAAIVIIVVLVLVFVFAVLLGPKKDISKGVVGVPKKGITEIIK